jgi:serine/threonine-protein phosphatase PPG1
MNLQSHNGIQVLFFSYNRGAGYQFGAQIVEKFLHVNKMRHILRAHQLCNEGYQVLSNSSQLTKILFNNRLSTVWSAPNYCYRCGNRASICEVGDNSTRMSFNVFDESPENEIVLKEQQSQNKLLPAEYFL